MPELKQKAKEFTDYLYDAYGSGIGILFGIPSNCKEAVYTIIKLVMEKEEKVIKDLKEWKDAEAENHRLKHNECEALKLQLEEKEFQYAREYNSNWGKREQLTKAIPKESVEKLIRNMKYPDGFGDTIENFKDRLINKIKGENYGQEI